MRLPSHERALFAAFALLALGVTAGCEVRPIDRNDGAAGADANRCTFSNTYVWNDQRMIRIGETRHFSSNVLTLTPPDGATLQSGASTSSTCAAPLPPCGSPELIDVADVEAALLVPDVQAVLSGTAPSFYGSQTIADPPRTYSFTNGDERGFRGVECSDVSPCGLPPPGVAALMELLARVIWQQLAHPSCASNADGGQAGG